MMNGSVEFIPKPLDAAALIAIIQRLIGPTSSMQGL